MISRHLSLEVSVECMGIISHYLALEGEVAMREQGG